MRGTLDRRGREADAWRPAELGAALEERERPQQRPTTPASAERDEREGPDPAMEAAQRELELQMELDSAYNRGYDDGRAEGTAAEAARITGALMALDNALAKVETETPRWMDALERNLVALACGIAREIVGREVKGDAEYVTAMVQQVMAEFPIEATVRIRMNPADLSAISAPQRAGVLQNGRDVRWVPDPSVAAGGCVVEGPESIIDGRIEKALEQVYNELVYG